MYACMHVFRACAAGCTGVCMCRCVGVIVVCMCRYACGCDCSVHAVLVVGMHMAAGCGKPQRRIHVPILMFPSVYVLDLNCSAPPLMKPSLG